MGKLYGEKRERPRVQSEWGCQHVESGGRLTRSRVYYGIALESISDILWLVLNWKQGQKLGKPAFTDQARSLGSSLQGL